MQNETIGKTFAVALGVCLVSSIFVSYAAVSLRDKQIENKKLDKVKNILIAGNLYDPSRSIQEIYNQYIKAEIIDLKTGDPLPQDQYNDDLNPDDFDIQAIADNPDYSEPLPAEKDIAGIRRLPRYMAVYRVIEDGELTRIIVPVFGKGLWSTLYGFLAIDKDFKTASGLTFYQHGETPGLGGEVDNPLWKASWKGKQLLDDQGNVLIEVIKGKVVPSSPKADHQVDGLSGATLTTRGINSLIRFWLGENGYGPFLKKLKEGSNNE